MDKIEEREAGGYVFLNIEDANLAKQELKKIEYLEKHVDYSKVENILELYKKAMADKIFTTPVGYAYLRRMQEYLLKSDKIDSTLVPPLSLNTSFTPHMRKSYSTTKQYVKPSEQKKFRWPLFSVIANIILALAIAGMFGIALESNNPNIINYKTLLTNQYSSWEQELSAREAVIREKEKELQIDISQ